MAQKKPVVLIVEDEPAMREGIIHNLEFEGFDVRTAADGISGLEAARSEDVDVIILDVMMPGIDGFEVLRRLRTAKVHTPVLVLTAKSMEVDKLMGFGLGADDYVVKPFSVLELVARVKALLKRREMFAGNVEQFSFGDVVVDFVAMEVRKNGEPIDFSLKEMEMLRLLIEKKGQVVSRAEMLKMIWGYDEAALPATRTIDTHVARIRSKLRGEGEQDFIKTIHKVGYKFQD